MFSSTKCKVISFYPVIQNQSDIDCKELNKELEEMNEMNRFVANYSINQDEINDKCEIVGDYKILYQTNSLLDIEFFVVSERLSKKEYKNIFVNLASHKLIDQELALFNIDRGKLYPYVVKFCQEKRIYKFKCL